MRFQGMDFVILGAGESGVGAAILAKTHGANVLVSDKGSIATKYRSVLETAGIAYEEGHHTAEKILAAAVVVKSPGIPENLPLLQARKALGKSWIGEIELGYQLTDAKIIAITGTNGKTTTTNLVYEMLKAGGFNVGVGGNIGRSFALQVARENYDWYVLEVSSFQLDNTETFRPHIAILTNITEDHLDRYNYQMEQYINSKFRVCKNQTAADYFIFCNEDAVTVSAMLTRKHNIAAQLVPFGRELPADAPIGAGVNTAEKLFIRTHKEEIMTIEELALQGRHNLYNSMAAGLASKLSNVRKESIREVLGSYEGVEHRLEHVLNIGGVKFINDSKATNVNSTMYALESMNGGVIWIAGGVDKGNDYTRIEQLVAGKVRALICLGLDNSKLLQEFGDTVEIVVETINMEDAVRSAYAVAKKGETVLLSPACASFDLFDDYEDRGNQFKNCIRQL